MNKIILIGNLTRDPELRTTQSGVSYCNFGLAVNRRFVNAQGVRETDFFNITAWRQLGENCAKYLSKGRKCAVTGALHARLYDAQDGSKRMSLDVQADDVEFLPSSSGDQPRDSGGYQQNYAPQQIKQSNPFSGADEGGFTDISDDDLPF